MATRHTYTRVKKVEETVEVEIPDEYSSDETPRGRVVDIILKRLFYVRDIDEVRWGVYSDEEARCTESIRQLKEAYQVADEIVAAMSASQ